MKKLVFPLMVAMLLLASVTPVFAKDKGPNGNNPHKQTPGTTVTGTVTPLVDETEDTAETPEVEGTPVAKEHGKSGVHGNPHGNQEKIHTGNPHAGSQNFVLFGKISAVAADSITVTVASGNAVVKDFIGQDVVIVVDEMTVVRIMADNPSERMTIADLAVGQDVRVHGWFTAAPEVTATETPAPDVVPAETTLATWAARQVNVLQPSDEVTAPAEG